MCVCAHVCGVSCPVRSTSLWHSFAHVQCVKWPPRTFSSVARVYCFSSSSGCGIFQFSLEQLWSYREHSYRGDPDPSRKHCFSASPSPLYPLLSLYVCVCMCTCIYMCVHACLYVCVFICVCVWRGPHSEVLSPTGCSWHCWEIPLLAPYHRLSELYYIACQFVCTLLPILICPTPRP